MLLIATQTKIKSIVKLTKQFSRKSSFVKSLKNFKFKRIKIFNNFFMKHFHFQN
jgi:hypothetical protein